MLDWARIKEIHCPSCFLGGWTAPSNLWCLPFLLQWNRTFSFSDHLPTDSFQAFLLQGRAYWMLEEWTLINLYRIMISIFFLTSVIKSNTVSQWTWPVRYFCNSTQYFSFILLLHFHTSRILAQESLHTHTHTKDRKIDVVSWLVCQERT